MALSAGMEYLRISILRRLIEQIRLLKEREEEVKSIIYHKCKMEFPNEEPEEKFELGGDEGTVVKKFVFLEKNDSFKVRIKI